MNVKPPALAFDRSMRHYDADGHLHVEICNIAKACVSPYFGREIPDWQALGLDPNAIYQLYRDPAELEAAAATFNNKPLLTRHVGVHADTPAQEFWSGTTGSECRFEAPYLKNSLAVWSREGIDLIESGDQEQLSPAYRYRADMTPGCTPEGTAYHGVMRDIKGNHVAQVAEGRQGPDVVVADSAITEPHAMSRKISNILVAALAPFLAAAVKPADVAIALDAAMKKAVDEEMELTEDEKKAAMDAWRAAKGKAADAAMSEDEKADCLKAAKDAKVKARDADLEGDPEPARIRMAGDQRPDPNLITRDEANKIATDAALAAEKRVEALHVARRAVEPILGIVAFDSAPECYRAALKHVGVADVEKLHETALAPMLAVAIKNRRDERAPAGPIALDSAARGDVYKAVPALENFKVA